MVGQLNAHERLGCGFCEYLQYKNRALLLPNTRQRLIHQCWALKFMLTVPCSINKRFWPSRHPEKFELPCHNVLWTIYLLLVLNYYEYTEHHVLMWSYRTRGNSKSYPDAGECRQSPHHQIMDTQSRKAAKIALSYLRESPIIALSDWTKSSINLKAHW